MPLIQVTMLEGRSAEQKEVLVEELTASTCRALGIENDRVHIFLYEVPTTDCGTRGMSVAKLQRNAAEG